MKRFWNLNPNVEIIPFAVEYTGGLGLYARRFIHDMLDIPKPPTYHVAPHIASATRAEREIKMRALYGFKASITAAIWRGNFAIYRSYVNSLGLPQQTEEGTDPPLNPS